jgi:hypothetical protein
MLSIRIAAAVLDQVSNRQRDLERRIASVVELQRDVGRWLAAHALLRSMRHTGSTATLIDAAVATSNGGTCQGVMDETSGVPCSSRRGQEIRPQHRASQPLTL